MRPAVRRNIKLAESPSFGETVFEYAPGCAGAQDFQALAESVVGEWDRWLAGRGLSAQVEPSAMGSPSAVG
jgi:chromosome partitioning protein